MTVNNNLTRRNIQAVTVATLIILLAIAALLIGVADAEWYVAVYLVLMGAGFIFILRSFVLPTKRDYAGPSMSDASVVLGILIFMVGVVGLMNEYVTQNIWVLAAVFLIAVALILLLMVFKNRK